MFVDGLTLIAYQDDPDDGGKPPCERCGGGERDSQGGEIVADAWGEPAHVACLNSGGTA